MNKNESNFERGDRSWTVQHLLDARQRDQSRTQAAYEQRSKVHLEIAELEDEGRLLPAEADRRRVEAGELALNMPGASEVGKILADPSTSDELRADWKKLEEFERRGTEAGLSVDVAAYHVDMAGWTKEEQESRKASYDGTIEDARNAHAKALAARNALEAEFSRWRSEKGISQWTEQSGWDPAEGKRETKLSSLGRVTKVEQSADEVAEEERAAAWQDQQARDRADQQESYEDDSAPLVEKDQRKQLGRHVRAPAGVASVELANEMEGQGAAAMADQRFDPKAVPSEVADRYVARGRDFVDPKSAKVAFVDHGGRLQTNKSFDGYAVKSMVAIACARGWDSMKVTGDEAFRRAAWFEATSRGLQVSGYKPTEAEKKAALSAAERNGSINRIERNPAVSAYLEASDPEGRREASRKHPELKNAFALQAAFERFSERLKPEHREAFMERQRRNIADAIAQGEVPAMQVRTPRRQVQQRDRQAVAER